MADRLTYLGPHAVRRLDLWVTAVRGTFGQPCYLVGSALQRADYRDVDVRMALPDDDPFVTGQFHRIHLVNVALSVWAQHDTGLPVDFQLQPQSEFDKYEGDPRLSLGVRWGQRVSDEQRLLIQLQTEQEMYRELLEAWCAEKGVDLTSGVNPGEPARNYELLDRLGVGGLVGLVNEPPTAASGVDDEMQAHGFGPHEDLTPPPVRGDR
jgi:hypothetical protein